MLSGLAVKFIYCPNIPTIPNKLVRKMTINEKILEKYKPLTGVWEITMQCNLNCLHCGSSADNKKRPDELSTDEAIKLVGDLHDLGNQEMVLSGGEPLLRKDWYEIGREFRDRDILLAIISNGLSINDREITKIRDLDLYAMGLSIDGLRENHDFLRGREGSFDKNIKTIQKLKDNGVRVSINTAVNHANIDDLVELRDKFIEIGVDAWQLQVAAPFGRMGQGETKHMTISRSEYITLCNFIVDSRIDYQQINIGGADCIGYNHFETGILEDYDWKGCQAGMINIGIESDGGIKGCLSLREEFIEGNIRDEPLKDIWCKEGAFAYTRNFDVSSLHGHCSDCDYGTECRGGCTVTVQSFSGKVGNNPYCLHSLSKEGWSIR